MTGFQGSNEIRDEFPVGNPVHETMSIQRNNPVNPAEFLILCPLVRWIPAQRLLKRNPRFTAVLSSSILYVLLFIILLLFYEMLRGTDGR